MPEAIRATEGLDLPAGLSEPAVLAELRALADANTVTVPMIGLGYSGTHTPPVVLRNVMENPAWYTAYTPYQPEISQGRLEALLNFQTVVTDLTGLAIAGSSLLDEGTAAAEAMTLARRSSKAPAGAAFLVDADCHPQTIAVVQTRARAARPRGAGRRPVRAACPRASVFGVLLQYPGSQRRRPRPARRSSRPAHERGAVVAVAADLLALTLLTSPGELGADVAVGSSQRFGVPLGYGGPHAGFMAVRKGLERTMPGRLVGVSVDADGAPGLPAGPADPRAAHPPREGDQQHLHRAGAARRHGRHVRRLPRPRRACATSRGAPTATPRCSPPPCAAPAPRSRTTPSSTPSPSACRAGRATSSTPRPTAGIDLRLVDADTVGISTDETTTRAHLDAVVDRLRRERPGLGRPRRGDRRTRCRPTWPRTSRYLTHPVFSDPPQRDGDAALPAPAVRQGPRAGPHDDPARLLHDEAQRHHRDGAGHLAGVRRAAPVHAGRATPPATAGSSTTSSAGCARSPATTPSACSPTPAARASSPACWRSAATTARTATPSATSASSRPAPTAPTPPAPSWPACASSSWRPRRPATSTSTTCTPRSTSTATGWPR